MAPFRSLAQPKPSRPFWLRGPLSMNGRAGLQWIRAAIVRRWAQLVQQNANALATILTAEQGKPLAEAKGEVAYAAAFLEWIAEEARRVMGEIIEPHQADRRLLVFLQPVGVVAAITT